MDQDSTVFTQRSHHIQHGPSFPKPIDILIDATTSEVTSKAEDGKVTTVRMELPADLSNGLPPNLLLNLLPSTPETKVSYLAPGFPNPRPKGTLPCNNRSQTFAQPDPGQHEKALVDQGRRSQADFALTE